MTCQTTTPPISGISRREGMLSLLGSALALAGCGGGGSGGGTGLPAAGAPVASAGAVTVGQITGFGSIILNGNGVRIDDSSARFSDDDDNDMRGKLRIGMQVEVVTSTSAAGVVTAQSITTRGELQGRVEGTPDAAAKTFVVLGQTVKVVAGTVFDSSLSSGFASLNTDTTVEVHGRLNTQTNTLTASFIERKTSPQVFKIQGVVASHSATAKTFKIGPTLISYAGATDVRVLPSDGALVRVRLVAVLPPAALPAQWQATRIRRSENVGEDRSQFEIEGSITAFTSQSVFSVNGVPVDASTAVFTRGAPAGLKLGAQVEVKGKLANGTLVAVLVKMEDDANDEREIELHGSISGVTATRFVLLGLTVEYGAGVEFRKGTAANLVNGAQVEVKGVPSDGSSAATGVRATRISFESS